jgi:hypothetical protein
MRAKTAISMVLVAGLGLALSGCYYGPGPDYAYYNSGYYGAPAYYGPSYYGPAYYGPSVGVYYYGGRWGGGDRRWH